MRILILFDLPAQTSEQRRQVRYFRKLLLRDGFSMLQESVYVRTCTNFSAVQTHRRRVVSALPKEGHVLFLTLTEPQYAGIDALLGESPSTLQPDDKLIVI